MTEARLFRLAFSSSAAFARLAPSTRYSVGISLLSQQSRQCRSRSLPAASFIRPLSRPYSSAQTIVEPPQSSQSNGRRRSTFRRILGFSAIAITSFVLGIATNQDVLKTHIQLLSLPSDEETNTLYQPPDALSRQIDDRINTHPLVVSLRADPAFSESRPHLKHPEEVRAHNLTGGTLAGPDKIVVPPYSFNEEGGKSFVQVFYLGANVSGHPGIVHGGLLATLLDEGLARCCFAALPNRVGVTANLNVDYRRPAPAGSFFVLRAKTVKVEGRKAWVEGWIEDLPMDGKAEQPTKYVEAKGLFVEPKNAALIPRLYRVE